MAGQLYGGCQNLDSEAYIHAFLGDNFFFIMGAYFTCIVVICNLCNLLAVIICIIFIFFNGINSFDTNGFESKTILVRCNKQFKFVLVSCNGYISRNQPCHVFRCVQRNYICSQESIFLLTKAFNHTT